MSKKEKMNTNIGCSFITFLEVIAIRSFDFLQFFSDKILDEPLSSLITTFLCAAILLLVNIKGGKLLLNKFPKLQNFIKKNKKVLVRIFISVLFIVSIIVGTTNALLIKDRTPPTIVVTAPSTNTVASQQYDTPLTYHIYLDDEQKLAKAKFNEEFVKLNGFTADIDIKEISEKEFVLSLTNITGEAGACSVTFLEGIASDYGRNKSQEINSKNFYLYNTENDIDNTAPEVHISDLNYIDDNTLLFKVFATDDRDISSVRLVKENLIFKGFTADIEIQNNSGEFLVTLNNIVKSESDSEYLVILTAGIATDFWNNDSDYFITEIFN